MLKINEKKIFFDTQFSLFEEKQCILIERGNTHLLRTKILRMEETAQHLSNGFLKTDFRFVMQLQKCVSNIKYMKFLQNHWSLLETDRGN
jgi:hypothetical protein